MLSALDVAITTVYRLVAARLERDFCLLAALSACSGKHLAWASVVVAASTIIAEPLGSSGRTTGRATLGFIGETFGSIEFLLSGSKGKGSPAANALDVFFLISHQMASSPNV